MDPIRQDLKYAVRALKKDRGFTITAVLTLALVLAANVAIFSVVNSVLLQPLPHPESDRLVRLFNSYPNSGAERSSNGAPDFFDRRQNVEAFEEVASYRGRGYALEIDGVPHRVRALQVTPSFFPVLRAQPRLGRGFTEAEGEVGNDRRAILSHALAQQLFGDESQAIGQALPLNGVTHQVVGVMAPDFVYLNPRIQLWTPQSFTEDQKQAYHSNNWSMVGRLAHGATIEQARAQVDALNSRNTELSQFSDLLIEAGFHTKIVPLQEDFTRDISSILYLLWIGVAFVLLIGCVNVANLTLVRASVRLRELSMRVVLGAGKIRVARQLVAETTLVAAASAVLGLGLGWVGIQAFTALGLEQLPRGTEVGIGIPVILATAAAASISGLVLGLIPVVYVMRVNTSLLLRAEGRSSTAGRRAQLTRRVLVAIQVATAFMLLIGAGLLFASFREVLSIDPGFEPNGVLTASVMLPESTYPKAKDVRGFAERALTTVRALPGVESVALSDTLPFGGSFSDGVMLVEGRPPAPGEAPLSWNQVSVSPSFFESLGVRLHEGRFFEQSDTFDAPWVMIIDDALAAEYWPNQSAIGKRMTFPQDGDDPLRTDENTRWYTIVGVTRQMSLRGVIDVSDRIGTCFFVYDQRPKSDVSFIIKSDGDPRLLVEPLRSSLAAIDAEMPLSNVMPLSERLAGSLLARRASMALTGFFAGVALFLAAVGLYGVLVYLVTQRTREIGIRLSLGSSRSRVFQLVMSEGVGIVASGLVAGFLLVVALRSAVASQLYGVGPLDPAVLTIVSIALVAVACAACCIPALRATRIHPAIALKE